MKVNMAPTFFDSVERMINRQKWHWKTWDFLRYDMPRFFRNLWMFRKDLYNYRWYGGQHAVLPFMKTALTDMASKIDERGMEVERSKDKKVTKIYRAAFLMERFIETICHNGYSMLRASGLPEKYFPFALSYATWVG
jgi:hypothetical protein